jgi:hypothetical protein
VAKAATPFGVCALGVFFVFGACMSGVSFASLLTPGGTLEVVWRVNPPAREAFAHLGFGALLLMSAVCIACALAAVGLFRRLPWGRLLAIAILTVNVIGDFSAAVIRGDPRTLVGLPIAGLLIAYLMRKKVRHWFAGELMPNTSLEHTRGR